MLRHHCICVSPHGLIDFLFFLEGKKNLGGKGGRESGDGNELMSEQITALVVTNVFQLGECVYSRNALLTCVLLYIILSFGLVKQINLKLK